MLPNVFHAFAEAAHLNEARADGEKDSRAYEEDYENIIRKIGIDCLHYGQECVLNCLHFMIPPKK